MTVSDIPYAELHCHTNFSFLDGASSPDDLVVRAIELGFTALAATDHDGLYGAVRFTVAANEIAGEGTDFHPIVGTEIELGDSAVADPDAVVIPARRPRRPVARGASVEVPVHEGLPARPRPARARLPGYRPVVREDRRGVGTEARGPRLVLLARDREGWRSLTRLLSAGNLAATKGAPRLDHVLLEEHRERVIALSGGRHGEIGRRLLVGDRSGARAAAERLASIFGPGGLFIELTHHLRPDDEWLITESVALATDLRLPVVVTNAVHYAYPWDREFADVLTAIRHGRTLDTLADLRRPTGEAYLKSGAELLALGAALDRRTACAWREGIERSVEIANACKVTLDFELSRFPGFRLPDGQDPLAYLRELCDKGALEHYGTITQEVRDQLDTELGVIERRGFAEFFLICWDLMRWAKEQGIPAQGRGSAAGSIVTYVLGISRVEPLRHDLLFERFISETGTIFPDVDIDFSSERREEVIQHLYETYGAERTGMVCNLVTYRARSATREVGYALGFPRALVDRVAKALETYNSVMVRRDLEADGGFAEFFRTPSAAETAPARVAAAHGLTDRMGQLDHGGGRVRLPGRAGASARRIDDKGGPGDSAASINWLRNGRGTGYRPLPSNPFVPTHEEVGVSLSLPRRIDRADEWVPPAAAAAALERTNHSSVARLEPESMPRARGGSTIGMNPWERWLEFCARIDSFPRHLSIHSGGMLITRDPLIDIAPIERATMPRRVVVQYDKRDVEALKLIKLDILGLGMLGAIDKTLRLIESDCGTRPVLDDLPEEIPEVYDMICAADTVGVFQIESRAQMQTLPKSRPRCLNDLIVEVAIVRPGPIQGNAVHPYLRRKQGVEKVTYLHHSLAQILKDSLGVILYQEQVMRIAVEVAGFTSEESEGFRRAMGTWRSNGEMEKHRARFVGGCLRQPGMTKEMAEELFRQCSAFASFGFAKSHAAAFARTAYESAFLKLFYPAQFLVGLIDTQPMGFYPTEVLVNDTRRHGVAVLPVDINHSDYRTTTEEVGAKGRPPVVVSSNCVVPSAEARRRWTPKGADGRGVRLGLHLVKGIGEGHAAALDAERRRGPYRSLADVVERTGLPEEVLERLIRAGALDSLGRPRRELLWQLREVTGASRGRMDGRASRTLGRAAGKRGVAAGRPLDLRLPATDAPPLPAITESERIGDAYGVLGVDAQRQVVSLFRDALDTLGAVTNATLADRPPGRVTVGGLVVTRQHPMTAKGTVFLALEDETGMVNVTLWPDTWARLRGIVRQHALLLVDGELQREGSVVNLIAHEIRPLAEVAGVRRLGFAGMRRQA